MLNANTLRVSVDVQEDTNPIEIQKQRTNKRIKKSTKKSNSFLNPESGIEFNVDITHYSSQTPMLPPISPKGYDSFIPDLLTERSTRSCVYDPLLPKPPNSARPTLGGRVKKDPFILGGHEGIPQWRKNIRPDKDKDSEPPMRVSEGDTVREVSPIRYKRKRNNNNYYVESDNEENEEENNNNSDNNDNNGMIDKTVFFTKSMTIPPPKPPRSPRVIVKSNDNITDNNNNNVIVKQLQKQQQQKSEKGEKQNQEQQPKQSQPKLQQQNSNRIISSNKPPITSSSSPSPIPVVSISRNHSPINNTSTNSNNNNNIPLVLSTTPIRPISSSSSSYYDNNIINQQKQQQQQQQSNNNQPISLSSHTPYSVKISPSPLPISIPIQQQQQQQSSSPRSPSPSIIILNNNNNNNNQKQQQIPYQPQVYIGSKHNNTLYYNGDVHIQNKSIMNDYISDYNNDHIPPNNIPPLSVNIDNNYSLPTISESVLNPPNKIILKKTLPNNNGLLVDNNSLYVNSRLLQPYEYEENEYNENNDEVSDNDSNKDNENEEEDNEIKNINSINENTLEKQILDQYNRNNNSNNNNNISPIDSSVLIDNRSDNEEEEEGYEDYSEDEDDENDDESVNEYEEKLLASFDPDKYVINDEDYMLMHRGLQDTYYDGFNNDLFNSETTESERETLSDTFYHGRNYKSPTPEENIFLENTIYNTPFQSESLNCSVNEEKLNKEAEKVMKEYIIKNRKDDFNNDSSRNNNNSNSFPTTSYSIRQQRMNIQNIKQRKNRVEQLANEMLQFQLSEQTFFSNETAQILFDSPKRNSILFSQPPSRGHSPKPDIFYNNENPTKVEEYLNQRMSIMKEKRDSTISVLSSSTNNNYNNNNGIISSPRTSPTANIMNNNNNNNNNNSTNPRNKFLTASDNRLPTWSQLRRGSTYYGNKSPHSTTSGENNNNNNLETIIEKPMTAPPNKKRKLTIEELHKMNMNNKLQELQEKIYQEDMMRQIEKQRNEEKTVTTEKIDIRYMSGYERVDTDIKRKVRELKSMRVRKRKPQIPKHQFKKHKKEVNEHINDKIQKVEEVEYVAPLPEVIEEVKPNADFLKRTSIKVNPLFKRINLDDFDTPRHGARMSVYRRHSMIKAVKDVSFVRRASSFNMGNNRKNSILDMNYINQLENMALVQEGKNVLDNLFGDDEEERYKNLPEIMWKGGAHCEYLVENLITWINPPDVVQEIIQAKHYKMAMKNYTVAILNHNIQQQLIWSTALQGYRYDKDWEGYLLRGQTYLKTGHFEQALLDMCLSLQCTDDNKSKAISFVWRSKVLEAMGYDEMALEDSIEAKKLDERSSVTSLRYAELSFEREDMFNYQQNMKYAVSHDLTDNSIMSRAKIKEKTEKGSGIGDFRTIVERNMNNVEAIVELANCLIARDEIEDGLEEFKVLANVISKEQIMNNYNNSNHNEILAIIYIEIARFYLLLGKIELAYNNINKGLELRQTVALGHYIKALIHISDGPYYSLSSAISQLNYSLTLNPHLWYSYELRGKLYDFKEQYSLAITDFRQAVRRRANLYWCRLISAKIFLKITQSYTTVHSECDEALFFDPLSIPARVIKSLAYEGVGYYNNAYNIYSSLTHLYPTNKWFYFGMAYMSLKMRKPYLALDYYTTASFLDNDVNNKTNNLLWRAQAYTLLRHSDEAINVLNQLILYDPSVYNYCMYSLNYYRLGNIEESDKNIQMIKKLYILNSDKLEVSDIFMVAKTYLECDYIDDCLVIIKKLRDLKCDNADIDNIEGLCELKKATETFIESNKGKKKLSFLENKEIFQKSLNLFNRAIEKDEKFVDPYINRAEIYSKLKTPFEAVQDYLKVIEYDNECLRAYNNISACYINQSQCCKSIEYLNKVIELSPNFCIAYYNHGLAYHRLNNINEAISDYNFVLNNNPKFEYALRNRGIAYYELNELDKANDDFNKLALYYPKYSSKMAFAFLQYKISDSQANPKQHLISTLLLFEKIIEEYPEESYYTFIGAGNICSRIAVIDTIESKEYIEKGKFYYNKAILKYQGDIYGTLGICHLLNIEGKGEKNKLTVKRLYAKTKNDEMAIESTVNESEIYVIPGRINNNPEIKCKYELYEIPESSLKTNKTDKTYHYLNNKAVIQYFKGKLKDSRMLFKSIIDKVNNYDIGIYNYSTSVLYLDPFESIKYLSLLIEKNNSNVSYLCNRGVAYILSNQYEKALLDLSQAIKLDNNNPFLYTNRASVYTYLKQYDKAIFDYSKAIMILPTNPINYVLRGKVYNLDGNIPAAMSDFSAASYIDKDIVISL